MNRKDTSPGHRLRVLRAEYGLSQMDVAARLGCGHNRYWRIENGFTDPTADEQKQLARLFQTTIADIFPMRAA